MALVYILVAVKLVAAGFTEMVLAVLALNDGNLFAALGTCYLEVSV